MVTNIVNHIETILIELYPIELDEMKEHLRSIQNQSLRDKDELQQLRTLYKVSIPYTGCVTKFD